MKESLILPLIYILVFVILLIFGCGMLILHHWAIEYNPEFQLAAGWFARQLPAVFFQVLPAAAIISVFLLFGRIEKNPGNRILSFLLPFLTAFAVIFIGTTITARFQAPDLSESSVSAHPLRSKTFSAVGSSSIYAEEILYSQDYATSMSQIVIGTIHNELAARKEGQVFEYHQNASMISNQELELLDNGVFRFGADTPVLAGSYAAPTFIRDVIEEIGMLNDYLLSRHRGSVERLVFIALALCFCAMSCRFFSHISSWPLFNVLLSLAVLRLIFFIFRLFGSDIINELIHMLPDSQMASDSPIILLSALGVLFIICDFLFIKPNRKRSRYGSPGK